MAAHTSERTKEMRRRRHRKKKLKKLKVKVEKANSPNEVEAIKEKIRKLTPGAEQIFKNWGIEDRR